MKIGIYEEPSQPGENPALAFAEGVAAHGHKVVFRNPSGFSEADVEEFDAVAVWGLYGGRDAVRAAYSVFDVPVMILDLGFIQRRKHFQIGINRLNWIVPTECPPDRFSALGVEIAPFSSNPRGHFLVLGQVPGDFQHRLDERALRAWLDNETMRVRAATGRDAYFRPHPNTSRDSRRQKLAEVLPEAFAAITYNSNAGLECLISGVPVFCDECAPYAQLGNVSGDDHDPSAPYFPTDDERLAFLSRVAYSQWTPAELRSGEAFEFLETFL